jgi:predicted  nucleic acid-binding Zn-ribbon protein
MKNNTNASLRKTQTEENVEVSIEQRLTNLYQLQQIETQIDRIRIIRGELPLEVQDLEDEIAGLETRIDNYIQQIAEYEQKIQEKKNTIKDCQALIKKYEEQQMNVRITENMMPYQKKLNISSSRFNWLISVSMSLPMN